MLENKPMTIEPPTDESLRAENSSLWPRVSASVSVSVPKRRRAGSGFGSRIMGMASRESQTRLFKIFTRLNPSQDYDGRGIGLAVVRKSLERMGGTVGVESEAGSGSRFWIELQAAKDP